MPDRVAAEEGNQEAVRGIGIVPPLSDQRNPQKPPVERSQKHQEEQGEQTHLGWPDERLSPPNSFR